MTISGCARSHYRAVRQALAGSDLDIALILEDDAVPQHRFDERLRHILAYANANLHDWDIINLGSSISLLGSENTTLEMRTEELLRTDVWSAAHALLVNKRALPAYERMMASVSKHDLRTKPGRSDWTLSHDRSLVVLVAVPSLVRQAVSHSDMLNRTDDYTPLFDESDRWLTTAMRMMRTGGWRRGQMWVKTEEDGEGWAMLDPLP
jgi:hypothetical protein